MQTQAPQAEKQGLHHPLRQLLRRCAGEEGELGIITNLMPQLLRRRYLDDFDYVAFLSGERQTP